MKYDIDELISKAKLGMDPRGPRPGDYFASIVEALMDYKVSLQIIRDVHLDMQGMYDGCEDSKTLWMGDHLRYMDILNAEKLISRCSNWSTPEPMSPKESVSRKAK